MGHITLANAVSTTVKSQMASLLDSEVFSNHLQVFSLLSDEFLLNSPSGSSVQLILGTALGIITLRLGTSDGTDDGTSDRHESQVILHNLLISSFASHFFLM